MKKLFILASVFLAVVITGCTKDEKWNENPDNAIRFSTTAERQTRATVTDNTKIKSASIGLFAYHTGSTPWQSYTLTTPNFMSNQEIKYTEQEWTYSPVKYWPNTGGDKVSFFGYWPYDVSTTVSSGALPVLQFTQEVEDAGKMKDFLVSILLDKEKQSGKVVLPFNHVLTRLNFSAKIDRNLGGDNATTGIFIKGLRILGTADYIPSGYTSANASGVNSDSRFFKKANYTLKKDGSNGWGNHSEAVTQPLDLTPIANISSQTFGEYTSQSVALSGSGSTVPLLKSNEYVFLIPPYGKEGIKATTDVRIQLDYEIVTKDDKLTPKYSITKTSATISLPVGTLIEGKAYNFIFTIGLTQIDVDGKVAPWEDESEQDATSAKAETNNDTGIIAAWESLNTAKKKNPNNNHFTIYVEDKAASSYNLSAAQVDDFVEGDKIELKFTQGSGSQASVLLPTDWMKNENKLIKSSKDYIEVNGVKVAKGNLVANGSNGAQIGKPTDVGLYFQFGSLIGWSTTGNATIAIKPVGYTGTTAWNNSWAGDPSNKNIASGTGDPCKYYLGDTWRLPTKEEFKTIMSGVNDNTVWGSVNKWSWLVSGASGASGALHDSGLFYPASGYRSGGSGGLGNVGSSGSYWSASPDGSTSGYSLYFSSGIVSPQLAFYRVDGFPVRCVQE